MSGETDLEILEQDKYICILRALRGEVPRHPCCDSSPPGASGRGLRRGACP